MRIIKAILSTKSTVLFLLLFAIAMASATFIENSLDTITAKRMVYNTWWFELILLILIVNLIANIFRYNLLKVNRLGGLVMHLALVVMILGAAITRYFGFEGSMHIREGASSNIMYSAEPVIQVRASDGVYEYTAEKKVLFSRYMNNDFNININTENGLLNIQYQRFVPMAAEIVEANMDGGVDIIKLTIANVSKPVYLKKGEQMVQGALDLAYDTVTEAGIRFITTDTGLVIHHSDTLIVRDMLLKKDDTLAPGGDTPVRRPPGAAYQYHGVMFALSGYYKHAITKYVTDDKNPSGIDAVVLNISYQDQQKEMTVLGGSGYADRYQKVDLNNMDIEIAYGDKAMELPFALKLNDFILDRYAGSMSPSSFKSKVEIVDEELDQPKLFDIYMNHVLDYKGYRFFQSSYDKDEKGSILSVNHDKVGTWVSYLGYMLLAIGFILVFFSKKSRFLALRQELKKIRAERQALAGVIALIMVFSVFGAGAKETHKIIPVAQADQFSRIIVQSYKGRLMPVHSLALDILHKISRKDNIEAYGQVLSPTQFLLDLMLDQRNWLDKKFIYIREQPVRDALGIEGKFASYKDFYDLNNLNEDGQPTYKLGKYAEEAFSKKPSEQNRFDKEIIKVDERVNVFSMAARGKLLRIFPDPDQDKVTWISPDDDRSKMPLTGDNAMINNELNIDTVTYHGIFLAYLTALYSGNNSGDYSAADKIISLIKEIQRNSKLSDELPGDTKVSCEIWYNNFNLFGKLKFFYALVGMILLILALYTNTRIRNYPILNGTMKLLTILLLLGMLLHVTGMVLRWVITNHAPWSNGYEALLLVSLACLIAGFSFYKSSKITLAATTVMAFLMLMTAGHSSYDPQLTNLQPVLKSYWLIIHVAVITISYGFLGMGFILGLISLTLYIFRKKKNAKHHNLLIKELSGINEIGLEIGLVLVTCGTFLGGVWANESWGRYWGWDAKETWSLISIIVYSIVLHLRLVPKLNTVLAFNIGSVLGFGSILMTFIGVNYYFTKGLHSYASGDTPAFPVWAWVLIVAVLTILIAAWVKEKRGKDKLPHNL